MVPCSRCKCKKKIAIFFVASGHSLRHDQLFAPRPREMRSSRNEQNRPDAAMVAKPDNGRGVSRSSSFPEPLLRYMPSVQAGVFFYSLFEAHSQPGERRESTQQSCGDLLLAAKTVEIPGPEHHVILRPDSETVRTTYFEPRRAGLAALPPRPDPGWSCSPTGPSEAYLYIVNSHCTSHSIILPFSRGV